MRVFHAHRGHEMAADSKDSDAKDPDALVTRFCEAWTRMDVDELVAYFTDDAVYHNIPMAPVIGRKAIASNIAANGPIVLTERVDVFTLPGKSFELPVMGTFEVSGGKISAWRDYFDPNQFTSRMG